MLRISTFAKLATASLMTVFVGMSANAADRISDFSLVDHEGRFFQLSRNMNKEAVKVELTIEEKIELAILEAKEGNFKFLHEISKKEFDLLAIDLKTKIFTIHHAYNKFNLERIATNKEAIKDFREAKDLYNQQSNKD